MTENTRNSQKLSNRLLILEIEKQKRLKSIDNKLSHHKKLVDVRINKYKLHKNVNSTLRRLLTNEIHWNTRIVPSANCFSLLELVGWLIFAPSSRICTSRKPGYTT